MMSNNFNKGDQTCEKNIIVFYSLENIWEDKIGCINLNFGQFEILASKRQLRVTAGRALYHESELPFFFATLLTVTFHEVGYLMA